MQSCFSRQSRLVSFVMSATSAKAIYPYKNPVFHRKDWLNILSISKILMIAFYVISLLAVIFCYSRRRRSAKNEGRNPGGTEFWNPTRELWEGTTTSARSKVRSSEDYTAEEIIRSSELFHNIDDEFLEKQIVNVKTISLKKGED